MIRIRTLLPIVLAVALAIPLTTSCTPDRGGDQPTTAVAAAAPIADMVRFGDAVSEQAHALRTSGTAPAVQLATEIGGFQRTDPTRTVSGKGSRVTATLRRPGRSDDLILEIQELHDRRPQAFGYTVEVNGTGVYFRTYEEVGGGPLHYFVRVPAALAARHDRLEVSFVSAGSAPFSLGRLWLYEDFFGTTDRQEQVYRPMALMGEPVITPEIGGPGRDFAPFGEYQCVNFLNTPRDAAHQQIRERLRASAETGRPVQILFNGTTWGGAPRGPDGEGGYYTDIRYSQLGYDANSHSWSPSYPNMWGSTFWTTSHEPHLQAMMRQRFLGTLASLPTDVDLLRARGLDPQVVYGREYGPPLGEVTAATIQQAAADGVKLDPTDGLDAGERTWLHHHDVNLWKIFAAWHAEAFPRDSVVVDRGTVRLPAEQALDNQYAHTVFVTDLGPMRDRRWFGGQAGMVDGFWSSGEVFFDRFELYDYVKANGKLGHINIWAPFASEPRLVRCLYDAGFQFATFIGASDVARKSLREADGCANLPALLPPHHLPALLEVAYHAQRTLGPADRIVSQDNIRIQSQSRDCADVSSASRIAVADIGKPGFITYRLDNGGEPLTALSLEVDGRVAPGKDSRIEVLLGDSADSLQPAAVITNDQLPSPQRWEPFMTSKATINLGDRLKGRKAGFLRLVFHAAGATDAAFLLHAKVTGQWSNATGHLAGNPFTMREQRTLNLWVQDRVVAQRLADRYRKLAGEDETSRTAQRLLAEGRYRSLQRLLSGALSEVLPARYAIRGHGSLGAHPLTVTLPSEDEVLVLTLESVDRDSCAFSVTGEGERQGFAVAMAAADGSRWSLGSTGANRFRLTRDAHGALVAQGGRVTATGEALRVPEPKASLPANLVARYRDGGRDGIRIDSQDPAVMGDAEQVSLPMAPGATVERTPDRLEKPGAKTDWPEAGDRVELTLDGQGRVTALRARYGHDRGRITAITPFSPMPPYSNGTLTLDDGRTYEFDFATTVDTWALHGIARGYEAPMLLAALRPGMEVEIDYSPYTERGTSRRLLAIRQPHHQVWVQDFTTMSGDDWRAAALSASGVVVGKHDAEPFGMASPENPITLMRPAQPFAPGTVVYEIRSDKPLKATALEFSARVYDDSSSIAFEASTDGGTTWVACGRFDNTWQNCYSQGVIKWNIPWNFVDLSRVVDGKTSFQLRLTLRVSYGDDRMALGRLRVMTEGAP